MSVTFRSVASSRYIRLLFAVGLLLLTLGTGYAWSVTRAAPAPGVVLLCVSQWTGQVRYVMHQSQCTNGSIVEINAQGQPGPQGPTGPQGDPGPPGPPGVSGLGNVVIRTATETFAANSGGSVLVACQSGEVATGGGFQKPAGVEIAFSGPSTQIGSSTPTIWWVQANNTTNAPLDVEAWVVCAAS